MSVNEDIYNNNVIHSHFVYRYRTNLIADIIELFNAYQREIRNAILVYSSEVISYKDKLALKTILDNIRDSSLLPIHLYLEGELKRFSNQELDYYYNQLRSVINEYDLKNRIKRPKDIENVTSKKVEFEDGSIHSLSGFLQDVTNKNIIETNRIIQKGYRQGQTTSDVSKEVETAFYSNRRQYETIISTMVSFVASAVPATLYGLNKQMIEGYQWISVMDSRTSDICAHLNSKVWYYNAPELSTLPGEITPPAHHRCRSNITPILKSAEELGIDIDTFTGKPAEEFSYPTWFNSQSSTVQEEILGPTRYKMYVAGDIKVTGFFTDDGRRLTLAELKAMDYTIPILRRK